MKKIVSITALILLVLCLAGCEKVELNDQIMQSFWNGQTIIGAGGSDINEGETVEGD